MAFSVSYLYQIIDRYTPSLNKITKATDRFKDTARRAGEATKKMSNRMDGMSTAVVGVLGAIGGTALISQFTKFEEAINTARGTTKATGEEFLMLKDKATALGLTTRFTATEAAIGIAMLGRNSLNTTQIMDGAIDAALSLAAATGTDLANAANISTDVMANFFKTSSDLPKIMDKITGTTLNSKFSIDDYRLALAQAGGMAGSVGVDLDDFNTTIAAISPSFSSGSDAGTSFKTFLARLKPESKEAARIMKRYGIITRESGNAFFDANNQMKSMAEISEILKNSIGDLSDKEKIHATSTIFGIDSMRIAMALARVGSNEFNKLAEAIGKVSAQELAKQRMEGLNGAIIEFRSAMEGVNKAIMEAGLAKFLEDVVDKGARAARAFASMPKWALNIIPITAGLIGLVVAIKLLAKALIILKGVMVVIATLFAVISAPIWAIVVAVTALTLAIIFLWKNWDRIKIGLGRTGRYLMGKREGLLFADEREGESLIRMVTKTPSQIEWEGITRDIEEGIVAANARIKEGSINGNININAPPGVVRSSSMEKTFPGDLGFNMVGAGA